jgi:toluene monooxygenase electron transfer component
MVNYDRPASRLQFVVKKKPGGRVSEWLFASNVTGAAGELFFVDELAAFKAQSPDGLEVTLALSDEGVPDASRRRSEFSWDTGFVHEVAARSMQGRFTGVRAYVAGPPPMVDGSLRMLLREARLSPSDIRYDKFS